MSKELQSAIEKLSLDELAAVIRDAQGLMLKKRQKTKTYAVTIIDSDRAWEELSKLEDVVRIAPID